MYFDVTSMIQRARELLKSNITSFLISGIIISFFDLAMFIIWVYIEEFYQMVLFGLLVLILHTFFMTSLIWYATKLSHEQLTSKTDLFAAFSEKQMKVILIGLIKGLSVFFGIFLLYIGALIPLYCFRFAENLLMDEEQITVFGALKKSTVLLKGHFWDLVKLDIRMIGWWSLYYFTSGLAGIYVLPFATLVYTEFYDFLKAQNETIRS